MSRGKQQVLFNYLPGRTFDFANVAAIARVDTIRGDPRTDLNVAVIIRKIQEEASAWQEEFRPALRDDVLRQANRFILIDPRNVQSELFPKVFWCQGHNCGRIFDFRQRDSLPQVCSACRQGQLLQLRFIKIHRCGALQPLTAPQCQTCSSTNQMALDTRGSERISNFRWVCRRCGRTSSLFGGHCRECQWPDSNLRAMDIEVHRAGRTYYAHTTVLLNIPRRELDAFFSLPEWPAIAAAKFLNMPGIAERSLTEFRATHEDAGSGGSTGLSAADLDDLMRRQANGELTAEDFIRDMQALRERRQEEQQSSSPRGIVRSLTEQTGVAWTSWQQAGQEMFEAVMPVETGRPLELFRDATSNAATETARRMGLSQLTLVSDYPIITASYGFSRAEYLPNECRLNPFPAHADHAGKYPIFVDQVQADALLLSLSHERVLTWLQRNGHNPTIPSGHDLNLARRAYFVQLFNDVSLRATLGASQQTARMVFGLLHTLSHLSVRQAALLCGLDRTSLSEYMLPRALTFAIYCNHRFGATIGALTALFEQSLSEWMHAVRDTRRCVYDPVCRDRRGNCHACTHLAETSCRFFNLNLSRAFLYGGHDTELGNIPVGYFDTSLN